jgi:hypothetical protein
MKITVKLHPRQQEYIRLIISESAAQAGIDLNAVEKYYPMFPDEYGELESLFVIQLKKKIPQETVDELKKQLNKHILVEYAENTI